MLKPLLIFLIISLAASLILNLGCVSVPQSTDFDADWTPLAIPGEPVQMCLKENDLIKLKLLLNSCEVRRGQTH